jgi:hypothetical protein
MRRIIGRYPFERMEAPPSKLVHDYAEWARGIKRIIAQRPAHALCPMDEQLLSTKH